MQKVREFQKSIYFCFIDYAKAFDCVDHNKLWKILKEMGMPDHLTCLLFPCEAASIDLDRNGLRFLGSLSVSLASPALFSPMAYPCGSQ